MIERIIPAFASSWTFKYAAAFMTESAGFQSSGNLVTVELKGDTRPLMGARVSIEKVVVQVDDELWLVFQGSEQCGVSSSRSYTCHA